MSLNGFSAFIKTAISAIIDDDKKTEPKAQIEISKKLVNKTSPKKSALKTKINVLRRSEDLPSYDSVISGIDAQINIPDDKISQYIVLLLNKKEDNVLILCSEQTSDLAVDNNYLNIVRQCRELGFKGKRVYVTKDIIDIILDKEGKIEDAITEDDKGPVHDRLREIFRSAKEFNTSDVHIEIRKGSANIYMRIDGDKVHHREIKEPVARNIARVAYSSLAKDKDVTFNERRAQDAKIDVTLDGENVAIRLATIPASPSGFDMVLRFLPAEAKEQEYKSLREMGYSEEHVKLLEIANAIPVGVIILCGVTGSGKTTTLTTMITNKMVENQNKLKAITIEDPPEVIMKNVTQVPVVRRRGVDATDTFAENMRASLRCDPDIIMPGEIRDKTTSSLLVSAVQSGHQVFTTLHAPSGIGSIDRLRELGVRSTILGSHDFISALVYQSLIPINCEHCSITSEEFLKTSDETLDAFKKTEILDRIESAKLATNTLDSSKVRFKKEGGCKKCNSRGITKREVIAEVIIPDAKMKRFFSEENDSAAIEYYRKSGGKFIIDHGLEKMFKGKVDPRSLERKVGRIDMTEYSLGSMLDKIRNEIQNKDVIEHIEENISRPKSSLNITPNKGSNENKVVDLRAN